MSMEMRNLQKGVSGMIQKTCRRAAAAGLSVMLAASAFSAMPSFSVLAAGSIVINEVCTKNTTVAAADGQFYDYVELYNTSGSAVNVGGFGISDDDAQPMRYTIPAGTTIAGNGYLTVYCGVEEGSSVQGAGFGLSKSGEKILLSNSGGGLLETADVPALADDTAFGRVPDGSETFAVLNKLTPGSTNSAGAIEQIIVPEPTFSQDSGFYSSGFNLTLSGQSGTSIYYTLDGSDPTTSSTRYSGAIQVYDKSSEENVYSAITDIADGYKAPENPVDKAMIVRAIAVDASGNVSDIATKTYFIGYTQNDYAMNMRVISLVSDPDNLFDDEKGIYVKGKIYRESGGGGMVMFGGGNHPANYTQEGREWERPAHITVFEKGKATYSAGVGIRMHGAWTRAAAQKSFNLYARADYGTAKLDYDFFNGQLTNINGKVIDSFDKITLRNGGNDDKTKIRDRLNQEMVGDRAYGTQAQTECVVFLDGEFWGTYNIVEKIGKEYIADHYKVKQGSVCMIKTDELSDGTDQGWADYEELKRLANSANYSDAGIYDQFEALMDLESLADYFATELIVGNSDFGNNNYALWKTEVVDPNKPYADGRWRFILFDTEYCAGLYGQSNASTNAINSLRSKNTWITKLFFGLLENNEQFRTMFLTCYNDQCDNCYQASKVVQRINQLESVYQTSMIATLERFSMQPDNGGWGGFNIGDFNMGDFNMGDFNMGDFNMGDWAGQQQGAADGQGAEAGQQPGAGGWQQGGWQQPGAGAQQPGAGAQQPGAGAQQPGGAWQPGAGQQPVSTEPVDYTEMFKNEVEKIRTFWNSRAENAKTQMTSFLSGKTTTASGAFTKTDVQRLQSYLLKKGTLSEANAKKYDLDNSQTITVKDLSLLKKRVLGK